MADAGDIIISLTSGFVGAVIGAVLGGGIAVFCAYWQTRETARNNLRAIVTRMAIHARTGRGVERATNPWSTTDMDEAITAYYRYRALLPFRSARCGLDRAWLTFQGHDPNGPDPFCAAPMLGESGADRATHLLRYLNAPLINA